MKLLQFLGISEATVFIHQDVRAALGRDTIEDFPGVCFFRCSGELAREQIRCGKHEIDSPEYNQCISDAEDNWYQCLKDAVLGRTGVCGLVYHLLLQCLPPYCKKT